MSDIILPSGRGIIATDSNTGEGLPVDARQSVQYYKDITELEAPYIYCRVIVRENDPNDLIHPKGIYVITKLTELGDVDPTGIKKLKDAVGINVFQGATDEDDGTDGLVPQPSIGEENCVLQGDGRWIKLTLANVSNQEAEYDDSTPPVFTGKMGYVVLQPEKKGDAATTFAAQIANKPNTIFEIRDVFNLNNSSVTIPADCTLKFNGGTLNHGNVTFNNTTLEGNVHFGAGLTIAQGSTVTNSELRVSWFDVDYRTEGLQNLFDLETTIEATKEILIDVKELCLNNPIIVCRFQSTEDVSQSLLPGKTIVRGLGMNVTKILPSDTWDDDGFDHNAFFIIHGNWNNRGTFKDMFLDGRLKVGYGLFFESYIGDVECINFEYIYNCALVLRGSETSHISNCRFMYCGCAILANPYGIYDDDNLINWSYNQPSVGTISQLVIEDNYIVMCNYGILISQAAAGCKIASNAFGYTSCYALIVFSYRQIEIESNYEEGCGCSWFWIYKDQLTTGAGSPSWEVSQTTKTMPSHLANEHNDIGGIAMQGWGFPHNSSISNGITTYSTFIRPKFLLEGARVVMRNNSFSMNVVRTKLSDTNLSTDNTTLGVDTVVTLGRVNEFVWENNWYSITDKEVSKYGITESNYGLIQAPNDQSNTIGHSTTEIRLRIIKDSNLKNYGDNWILVPYDNNIAISYLNDFNTFKSDLIGKNQNIDIVNKCGNYAYNIPMTPTAFANYSGKNIFNMSQGNVKVMDGIPFFKIEGQYSTLFKGYSFIFEKTQIVQNTRFCIGLYNDNEDDEETTNVDEGERTVLLEIYDYNSSSTATRKTYSTLKLASKELKYVSMFVQVEDISGDYVGVSVRNNTNESTKALGDVYMTIPYPQGCQDRIDYTIKNDVVDELGRFVKGTTENRPVGLTSDDKGFRYYDETLQKNIVWNGTAWVNEDGSDLGSGTVISVDTITESSDMPTMLPNRQYNYGTIGAELTEDVEFNLGNVINGETSVFYWTFTTDSSLAHDVDWPTGITWADGNVPTIDPSTYYEVMVCNGVATCIKI